MRLAVGRYRITMRKMCCVSVSETNQTIYGNLMQNVQWGKRKKK